MPVLIFLIAGAVFLVLFLKERIRRPSSLSLIFKALTSVCFLSVAFSGIWIHASSDGAVKTDLLVAAGLFCGLLGDIWLDLKWNCPAESDRYTFAGFWSFAAGHVLFLISLIVYQRGDAGPFGILIPLLLAAVLGIAVGMGGKLMGLDYGRFRNITMLYGTLLISTTLVSGRLLVGSHFQSRALMLFFAGAVLFLLSDLVLSGTYFGKGKNRPKDVILNHVLYYAGQFLIAFSVMA